MHSFYELSHYLDGDKICLTTVDTIFKEEEFSGYIQQFIQEDKLDGLMAYPFSKIIDVDHADDILKAESFLKS